MPQLRRHGGDELPVQGGVICASARHDHHLRDIVQLTFVFCETSTIAAKTTSAAQARLVQVAMANSPASPSTYSVSTTRESRPMRPMRRRGRNNRPAA